MSEDTEDVAVAQVQLWGRRSPRYRGGSGVFPDQKPKNAHAAFLPSQGLMHSSGPVGRHRQLVLVLEGELYLIPFALLKGSSSNEYLYERFSLIAVPSIQALSAGAKVGRVGLVPPG